MTTFGGDKKEGTWLLKKSEDRLRDFLIPLVPQSIQTYHLTLCTLLWSVLILLSAYLAEGHIQWLWLSSFCIVAQYITDVLDGSIGRIRNTGLIKWGYYMDHFLDFIFMAAFFGSFFFLFPVGSHIYLFLLFFLAASFMVHEFLYFSVLNEFKISIGGIGPTEVRIGFIILNTIVMYLGILAAISVVKVLIVVSAIVLVIAIWKSQKAIWDYDMSQK